MKQLIFLWITCCHCFLVLAQEQRDYLKAGIREYEVTNYSKAVAFLDLEIERNPSAEAYYYRAQAKARLKDYTAALTDFTLSLSVDPHQSKVFMYRGCVHYELEHYKEAINDFSKALEYRPNYYEATLYRAEAETKIELYKEALQDYQAAIMLNPYVSNNYLERGRLFLSLKRYKEALADFDNYISKYPMEAECYIYRARARRSLQDETGALEDERKAKDLKSNKQSDTNEGIAQYNLKNYSNAVEQFNLAIQKNKQDGRAYLYRAWSLMMLKKYPASLLDFNKAVELTKDADAFYGRAFLKHTLRDYTSAIVDYDQAILLRPSSIDAYLNRGLAKMQSGDDKGAQSDFKKIIQQDEENFKAYYSLAQLEKKNGEVEKACEYLKKAAEYGDPSAEDEIEIYCK